MRRVIKRFVQHLETEKNARPATIAAYQHDLQKFHEYRAACITDYSFYGAQPTTARYLHTRSEELVSAVNRLQLYEGPMAA